MKDLNDIMPGEDEQVEVSKLEKEKDTKSSEKKFVAMDESSITCIATDSPEIRRAFALIGYKFYDEKDKEGHKTSEPKVVGLQRVVINYEMLEAFFKEMAKVKSSLLKLEGLQVSPHIEFHVAQDKPLKVVMRLTGEDKSEDVRFYHAPRIESD